MVHDSPAPGFDMAYRPVPRQVFGPRRYAWIAPAAYLAVGLGFTATVLLAEASASDSWLFRYFVEGDLHRLVTSRLLALILMVSGLAAVLRTAMRGVLIHSDGVEVRGMALAGWPRVRSCDWVEVRRVLLDGKEVGLRLWNGTTYWLPSVSDPEGLSDAVAQAAFLRSIPVSGEPRRLSVLAECLEE